MLCCVAGLYGVVAGTGLLSDYLPGQEAHHAPCVQTSLISALLLASIVGACTGVQAEMQAMDDSELSEVTGQALINLDALTYGV